MLFPFGTWSCSRLMAIWAPGLGVRLVCGGWVVQGHKNMTPDNIAELLVAPCLERFLPELSFV